MIERLTRRRAHDDEHIIRINPKRAQLRCEVWIGREVREIDVLFRPVVAPDFARTRAEAPERRSRKSARHNDARRQPKRQMIRRLMLIIHQRHRLYAERTRRHDLRIRVMTDRERHLTSTRPTPERPRAPE